MIIAYLDIIDKRQKSAALEGAAEIQIFIQFFASIYLHAFTAATAPSPTAVAI